MKTSSYDEPDEEEPEDVRVGADETFENYDAPVAVSYEARVDYGFEEPIEETCEEEVVAAYETQPAEIHEAPVPLVISQREVHPPSEPPPVPKRTLLPNSKPKRATVPVAAVPAQHDITEVTEDADVQNVAYRDIELVSPEEVTQKTETGAERWSDSTSVSLPGQDAETVSSDPGNAHCEPTSEMYYTASSEVSLLSDTELVDKVHNEDEDPSRDDRKNVISGHVAAMRERFESMTRTNTPCPDLVRSLSPSLEVFRNASPSPDRLA